MLKLAPYCCSAIWGGTRLHCEYGFESAEPQIAEAWLLSCHPNGPSIIKEDYHVYGNCRYLCTRIGII